VCFRSNVRRFSVPADGSLVGLYGKYGSADVGPVLDRKTAEGLIQFAGVKGEKSSLPGAGGLVEKVRGMVIPGGL